ncbi:rhomboid family intramembrane serine protease [Lentisphaera marina]|uniref:rhomboid family intramembrane serine protease n=1 Tax=Lentisphaera marina TaxID=1111041 RepID=UPI002364FE95|nr:rhomboid family intramembrane serine protease [Lentisphaera marina]MDD7986847.1 rhomboid family intramembrane serine protease [Lentisphaera marina]
MAKMKFWERFKISFRWVASLLVFMGVLEFANHLSQYALSVNGGIIPRDPSRLWAIFTAPFLHFSPEHYILNSISFAILGGLVVLEDRRIFVKLTLFSCVFAGLAVWLVGRPNSVHAGSSLLIFSYFGFVVASGWFAKNWKSFFLAILIGIIYGGMVFEALPTKEFISWESHLFGIISGVLFAKILGKRKV